MKKYPSLTFRNGLSNLHKAVTACGWCVGLKPINTKARRLKGSKAQRKAGSLDFKRIFDVFFVPLRLCAFVLISSRRRGSMRRG